MFSNQKLTDEDYSLLPCYARAYKCSCKEKFENDYISLTPPYLRFPHDDPSQHLFKITVWNKTREYQQLVIQQPKTNVFQAFYQKSGLYGGAQTTIVVKCNPRYRKICFDCLRISVMDKNNQERGIVSVPLELFPGMSWFILPKLIVMPHVTVGNGVEVVVKLPRVEDSEEFFVVIRTPDSDALQVTPFNGFIGNSDEGLRELVVHYHPKEYTTLVYIIEIHFPNVDTTPVDIIIFARSIPGFESEAIMRETARIASLKPKESQKKVLEPRIKPRPNAEVADDSEDNEGKEDLCTPAGVMHFLLRKGGKFHENAKTIGALGLSTAQEQKAYKALEKDFHERLNRSKIKQNNILLQNHKSFYGDEPIDSQPALFQSINREKEHQLHQYEKALGLTENDAEDMSRTKLKVSNQRSLRRVGEDYGQEKTNLDSSEIEELTDESRKFARQLALTRFIQMAYIVITRYRCTKRLGKLKIMQVEIKSARRKAALDGKTSAHQPHDHDHKEHGGTHLDHHLKGAVEFEELKNEALTRKSIFHKDLEFLKHPPPSDKVEPLTGHIQTGGELQGEGPEPISLN